MRVLLISFSNNYDHQLSLYSLFDDLKKRGLDVHSIGIKDPKYKGPFSDNNYFYDVPKKPGFSLKALSLRLLNKMYKFIIEQNFDIVYFESLHIWNVFLFNKLKKKTKIIHSIHDVIPHEGGSSFFIKKFNKIIYKKADIAIVRSKTAFDYCMSNNSIPHHKIRYIPLARRWKQFNPCSCTGKVLFFGRLTKYKGLDNLAQVCLDLQNINFYVVGKLLDKSDDSLLDLLKKQSNVEICNEYVNEEKMQLYFNNSDCVILPYNSATQSGVVVDSYMMSRPCIAFDVGGINEQIIDGETGFLVEKDVKLFEKKILEYMNSSQIYKKEMCEKAYAFGKRNYSSDAVSRLMDELFKESLKE